MLCWKGHWGLLGAEWQQGILMELGNPMLVDRIRLAEGQTGSGGYPQLLQIPPALQVGSDSCHSCAL